MVVEYSLSHIVLPDDFRHKDYQWNKLLRLWGGVRGGIEVSSDYTRPSLAVRVIERLPMGDLERVSFWYSRDVGSKGKYSHLDFFGLIGLSMLSYQDRSVIITEGVSDFLSARMVFPDRNVLGFTTLGGTRKANRIICSLFDEITYFCDNDVGKEVNTGLRAAGRLLQFYQGLGKSFRMVLPAVGYNDFTEEFMDKLKRL